jgi:hypothetical protein
MNPLDFMNTILNKLGLAISIGGTVAKRVKKQTVFMIVAAALVVTTASGLVIEYMHQRQISHI